MATPNPAERACPDANEPRFAGGSPANSVAPYAPHIGNLALIDAAYGSAAAETAQFLLQSALDQCRTAQDVEAAAARLSLEPVSYEGAAFHLALKCSPVGGMAGTREWSPRASASGATGEDWVEQYRDDMASARQIFASLSDGTMGLLWQPVRAADYPYQELYYEALTRIEDGGGDLSPSLLFPLLERLELTRAFDRHVVSLVVDELEKYRGATLGVNISGQSACPDFWWTSLFERLRRRPDVARRLIIEITETSELAAEAPRFAEVLRGFGCRIALDDFGVGHASLRNALAIGPDIIKIDAFFLRRAAHSAKGRALFEHLLGISASIAPAVVIEGVESEEQSCLVRDAQSRSGADATRCWQQGYHFGGPALWKPWRHQFDNPEIIELRQFARSVHQSFGGTRAQ